MKRILTGIAIALILAAGVQAQAALTGKWQGKTRSGSQLVLDLTATRTALSGTLTLNGQSSPIADGRVSKNTFTFNATLGDQTADFTGELAGDEMRVWMDRQGPERAAVLKRAK